MNVLDKIKKIKSDKEEAERIATEKLLKLHDRLDAEKAELYELLKKNLMEINGEKVDKYEIKILPKADYFELHVNDFRLATLMVERRYYRCGHDYQCDCEGTYNHLVSVKIYNSRNEESGVYFPCTSKKDFQDDMFPAAIFSLIERYNYRNF